MPHTSKDRVGNVDFHSHTVATKRPDISAMVVSEKAKKELGFSSLPTTKEVLQSCGFSEDHMGTLDFNTHMMVTRCPFFPVSVDHMAALFLNF